MPTSLIIIDLPDIVGFMKDIAMEKIMSEMLHNAIVLKQKPFYIIKSICYVVLQKRMGCCRM